MLTFMQAHRIHKVSQASHSAKKLARRVPRLKEHVLTDLCGVTQFVGTRRAIQPYFGHDER